MAENDVGILWAITTFFILMGLVLPFFSESVPENNVEGIENEVRDGLESVNSINAFTLILSVAKMFTWTFGDLHWFLDLMLLTIRIPFGFLLARNIWVGGGG